MGETLVRRFGAQDSKVNAVSLQVEQEIIWSPKDQQGKVEGTLGLPKVITKAGHQVDYLGGNVYQLVETGEKLWASCFKCGTLAADRWFRLNCHRLYCPECAAELHQAGASLSLAQPPAPAAP